MGLYQDVREDSLGNVFVNINDGSGNALTSTAGALNTYISGGMITTGVPDETAFVYGASGFQPIGGVYNSSITALTSGQSGAVALTPSRSFHSALYDASGVAVGDTNAHGLFVKPGDGTNVQAYSATSEAFVQLRQGGNVGIVNASGEQLVKDTAAEASLTAISGKLSPSTGTLTQVALTSSSQTALALNASRKGFVMVNDSNKTVWIAFSASSSSTVYTYKILANSSIEPNFGSYTGVISVISQAGVSGNLVITELT